jgi:hypothetical protein
LNNYRSVWLWGFLPRDHLPERIYFSVNFGGMYEE